MKKKNRFLKDAEQDLEKIIEHYDNINLDLADNFLDKNQELLDRIADAPEQFPKIYKEVRIGLC